MTDSGRISLSRTDLSEVIRHLDFAWQEFSSMPQQKYVGRAGTIKRLSAKLAKVLDRARPPIPTKRQAQMTIDEYRRLSGRPDTKGKYGALRSGGHASRKEHRRSLELRLLERSGLISGLREQVRFELVPAQRGADGTLVERSCCYVADFVYTDSDGRQVVEDTKGVRTKEYIIKRKLMLYIHGIRIRET